MKIRTLRRVARLTQKELAKHAGTTQAEVSRAERQPDSVRVSVLSRIVATLGSDLGDLAESGPLAIEQDVLQDVFSSAQLAKLQEAAVVAVPQKADL
ncbi:MAG: helix-turn-helix transcriptional regulator [Planctomycetota bacterium]